MILILVVGVAGIIVLVSTQYNIVYGLVTTYNVDKVYIDGANPSFIKSFKLKIGEEADYHKVIATYRSDYDLDFSI